MATGSVEPLKKLYSIWGARVRFVDVLVRQAHPGRGAPPYRSFDEKLRDTVRYKEEERIPWPVLVDDLQGTVHQVYGGLSDPAYLIDADGYVAYYSLWTKPSALHRGIAELLERNGRGLAGVGVNRAPGLLPVLAGCVRTPRGWRESARPTRSWHALRPGTESAYRQVRPWRTGAFGWRGISRGLPQSYIDLEIAMPGSGAALWVGHRARRALSPLANRLESLPRPARAGLAAGGRRATVGRGDSALPPHRRARA